MIEMKLDVKLKDKLLKLYELSKRGVDGEKTNAELMLSRMLDKHNLSLDDIDQDIPKKRYYKYTTKMSKDIISQIAFKVLGSKEVYLVSGYREVSVTVTDFEHIQILEMIDFHLSNFEEERKLFLKDFTSAYIQKHRLFRDLDKDEDEAKRDKPLTLEEKQAIWRMMNIKNNLSDKSYTKKLYE